MSGERNMSYVLIFIGIGVLLFTVYLGYTFYQSNIYHAMLQQQSHNLQTTNILQNLVLMISSPNFLYAVMAIILLLIMISVGFRFIKSGTKIIALKLEMESGNNPTKKEKYE